MSSNTLIAIVAASLIAFICLILIIAFVVWRCRSIERKHGKKPPEKGFHGEPTILMPASLNKTPQQLHDRSVVYTVQMPEKINPKRASVISKQQRKNDKQPKRVWRNSDLIQTQSYSFVWRPMKNESGQEDVQKNIAAEETQETVSDRQRKPHKGSIRYLPSRRY